MLNEQKMLAAAEQSDLKRQESALKIQHLLENKEAEQLLAFSKTGLEFAKAIEKGRIEEREAQASALFYEDMMAVDQAEADHDAAMAELEGMRDEDEQMANKAFVQGLPYETVRRWRNLSGHQRAKYGELMAENAGSLYQEYQDEQFEKNQTEIEVGGISFPINDPEDLAQHKARSAETRKEFIKMMDISKLTPGLQAKAFKLMRGVDAKLDKEFEQNYNIEKGFNDRAQFDQQLKDGIISAEKWFELSSKTPGVNGTGTFPFPDLHKRYGDLVVDAYLANPEKGDAMIAQYENLELNGKKFSDIHRDKIYGINGFRDQIRVAVEQRFNRDDAEGKRKLQQFAADVVLGAAANRNFTKADSRTYIEQYQSLAASLKQDTTVPRALLNLHKNFSAGAKEVERMMLEQENKRRARALDPEEILTMPQEVQDEYLKDAQAQHKARMGNIDNVLLSAKNLVTKHPNVVGSKGLEGGGKAPMIYGEFEARIKDAVVDGLKNDPDANPVTLAEDEYKQIELEFEKGIKDPTSRYYIGDEGKLFPMWFGENGTAENALSRQLSDLKKAQSLNTRVANEGYGVFEDKLIIADSFQQLAEQRKHYMRTGMLPAAAIHAARKWNLDPFKLFNAQTRTTDTVEEIPIVRDAQEQTTQFSNTVKQLARGYGNQTQANRVTTDSWPVRSIFEGTQLDVGDYVLNDISDEDFYWIAFACAGEAKRGTMDEAACAAVILTRMASPNWPGETAEEIVKAPGQFAAMWDGNAHHDPNLLNYYKSKEGRLHIKIWGLRLQDRDSFKGLTQLHNKGVGDVQPHSEGNFYHYAGQTPGSGPYTGPKTNYFMNRWLRKMK